MTRLSAYPSFRTALPPQPFPCIIEACLRAGNRPATMTYRISVERNTLRFAAAHFTTFGGQCEPLHGHNYDVLIELEGGLTPDSWVFDFGKLKAIAAGLCPELDHRFLLPLLSSDLQITQREGEYEVRFEG